MATGPDLPHLEEMLARARNGDREAENELFDYVLKRFEVIVRHIYRLPARADVSVRMSFRKGVCVWWKGGETEKVNCSRMPEASW
jgi:hypothetical protein